MTETVQGETEIVDHGATASLHCRLCSIYYENVFVQN